MKLLYDSIKEVTVAPYWNVNEGIGAYYSLSTNVTVAPYWNVNRL